jgi:hypothetical protein
MIKLRHVVSCSVMSIFVVRPSVRSFVLRLVQYVPSHCLSFLSPFSSVSLLISSPILSALFIFFFSFHLFLCSSPLSLLFFSSHDFPSFSIPSPTPPSITILYGALFSKHFISISFCSIYNLSVFASKLFFTSTFPTFVLPFSFSFFFFFVTGIYFSPL